MPPRHSLLPARGNPMRPVLIYLAIGFGVMLIGFPALVLWVGLGVGEVILIAVIILLVALLCLAILRKIANAYEVDRQRLLQGDTLAEWQLSIAEHRSFLADERRRTNRIAAALAAGGIALGTFLGIAEDWLLGGIMIGSFLLAATVALTLGGPPRNAADEAGREVLIGQKGVRVLNRYLPFRAPMTRLHGVRLEPGDPAVLVLTIRSGRRLEAIRIPVPRNRLTEGEALMEHLQRQLEWE